MPETLDYRPRTLRQQVTPYGGDNDAVWVVLVLAVVMLSVNLLGLLYRQHLLIETVSTVGLFIFPIPNTTGLMIVLKELRQRRSVFRLFVLIVAAATAGSTLYAWYAAASEMLNRNWQLQ